DAAADQVRANGLGATGAQGQVVFARAALVGVAFDADGHLRVAGQPGGLGGQPRLGLGTHRIRVQVEVDAVADVDDEVLFRARRGGADVAAGDRGARRGRILRPGGGRRGFVRDGGLDLGLGAGGQRG